MMSLGMVRGKEFTGRRETHEKQFSDVPRLDKDGVEGIICSPTECHRDCCVLGLNRRKQYKYIRLTFYKYMIIHIEFRL